MMLEILKPIEAELQAVERRLVDLQGDSNPHLVDLNQHLFAAGGKRLRPAAFLLGCRLFSFNEANLIDLACAFEYIHAASLLHDDVIDKAATRRNQATINAKWGDTVAILLGDRNYALACRVFVRSQNLPLIDTVARCIQEMSESEIFQLRNLWRVDISQDDYEAIARGKTAILFEACTLAPALLAECHPEVCDAMARFGSSLGMAFQILDDCLDLAGDAGLVGKPLLADLAEGKVTLPLILGMSAQSDRAQALRTSVAAVCGANKASYEQLQNIQTLVRQTGGLDKAQKIADAYSRSALSALQTAIKLHGHVQPEAEEALMRVITFLSERKF